MNAKEFQNKISFYIRNKEKFFFIVDFEIKEYFVCGLKEAASQGIFYNIKGQSNFCYDTCVPVKEMSFVPIEKIFFLKSYKKVMEHINRGDSYLLNLTFPSKIDINLSLREIFNLSQAPYCLLYKDKFVVFSPECFIRIENDYIYSYPMKGTVDATIKDAEKKLIENKKELYEHNTIVDLLRNDISMVAQNITLTKFRFVEEIKTNRNKILQTSSEIRGELSSNWKDNLAQIILKLLPAGSISGAPKKKTLEIIKENEVDGRGFYTGVFGIFDGVILDSAVAIRFIENREDGLYFRSGGGITAMSDVEEEYKELIQKIYVPTI